MGDLWVMLYISLRTKFEVGGHQTLWDSRGYRLSEVWVRSCMCAANKSETTFQLDIHATVSRQLNVLHSDFALTHYKTAEKISFA